MPYKDPCEYVDPGDDEREAIRLRKEIEGSAWKMWTAIGISVGGPLLVVVLARWLIPT